MIQFARRHDVSKDFAVKLLGIVRVRSAGEESRTVHHPAKTNKSCVYMVPNSASFSWCECMNAPFVSFFGNEVPEKAYVPDHPRRFATRELREAMHTPVDCSLSGASIDTL